jgi:hypothetical protein
VGDGYEVEVIDGEGILLLGLCVVDEGILDGEGKRDRASSGGAPIFRSLAID